MAADEAGSAGGTRFPCRLHRNQNCTARIHRFSNGLERWSCERGGSHAELLAAFDNHAGEHPDDEGRARDEDFAATVAGAQNPAVVASDPPSEKKRGPAVDAHPATGLPVPNAKVSRGDSAHDERDEQRAASNGKVHDSDEAFFKDQQEQAEQFKSESERAEIIGAWRRRVETMARGLLIKDPEYHKRGLSTELVLEPMVRDLQFACGQLPECASPTSLLSATEIQEDLEGIARRAAGEFFRKRKRDQRLRVIDYAEFLSMEIPVRNLVLAPIIHERDWTMIYSWRGTGKTYVGLDLGWAMSTGSDTLRWNAPTPRRVLYIDGEMAARAMKERLARVVAAHHGVQPPDPSYFRLINPELQELPIPNLSEPSAQRQVDELIGDAEVIFFDSISTLFRGGKENETDSWSSAQDWALRLRRRGKTGIFFHHEGKAGSQRGTSKREDTLDLVLHLVHPADYKPTDGARFEVHFEKFRGLSGEALKPFEAALKIRDGAAVWTTRDIEGAKFGLAVELFEMRVPMRDVASELKVSPSTAYRLRDEWMRGKAKKQEKKDG